MLKLNSPLKRFIFLQLTIICASAFHQSDHINNRSISKNFYNYLQIIKCTLLYMKENINDMNLDSFFGVLLTDLYLRNIKINNNDLKQVLKLSNNILMLREKKLNLKDYPHLFNIESYFMNKNNWKSIVQQSCNLKLQSNNKISLRKNIIRSKYLNYRTDTIENIFSIHTSPNEIQSDICLSEIITKTNETIVQEKNYCKISRMCFNAIMTGPSSGYSKTHRLLYFLICRNKGCLKCGGKPTNELIKKSCYSIINEALLIEKMAFPLKMQDLFMEQVILCAMSGYMDVLKPKWIELISSWQRPEGCWGYYYSNFTSFISRWKRSNTFLGPMACSSHSTGLGITVLAIALNKSFCQPGKNYTNV